MKLAAAVALACLLGSAAAPSASLAAPVKGSDDMLIIAHRGASGERPEHTLAAYERAIDQGADYIEPDLVVTSDQVLIARHENEISETTDVADRAEFADRRRSKTIDGQLVSGWFAEDFTLAELRSLRARERLPAIRPASARFDGLYPVPTLAEIIALVRAKETETGRRIGIYPELKHPTFLLQEAGIDVVDLLVRELERAGYRQANDPVFIQNFEVAPLRRLDRMTELPLVQLVASAGGPADEPSRSYAEMVTPAGLAEIATYADGLGASIDLILAQDGTPTPLVANARAAGLPVHAWTLRKENLFLPPPLRSAGGEGAAGDIRALWHLLQRAGVSGVFTDDPALVVDAR
jgi:glycerophosphoryl diester phosphodiesterase